MFAGWPVSAAQDVLDDLTAALDTEIDLTSDTDKRSRLIAVRDGLLGAARDIAIAWAERKIGDGLTRASCRTSGPYTWNWCTYIT